MTWNQSQVPDWYRRAVWTSPWSKRNGVHYVGDDVIIDLSFMVSSYDTFQRTANFENGTDGQTITTADRGDNSAFDAVNNTPQYDSTHSRGRLAMKISGGTSDEYVRFFHSANKTTQHFRIYLYATAWPNAETWIARHQFNLLGVLANGRVRVNNTNSTQSIPVNRWVRIEYQLLHPTTNTCRIYHEADATTPTETVTDSGGTSATDGQVQFGCNFGPWGSDFWLDSLVANADGWPGRDIDLAPIGSPVTYTVRDFFGTVVSQGTFEEGQEWFRPDSPNRGGWKPGWYRVYLTGDQTSVDRYDSYGATNFCVIRDDSHFVSMPAGDVIGGYNGEHPDYVMKGVMGLGTSRLIIDDAANPSAGIAQAQQELALTRTYWANTGTPDTERPAREPWCTFPNGGASTQAQLDGVTAVVSALYPDCKYYEGPENEPAADATTASKMQAFAAAVHAGNANAKAIGPCFVQLPAWEGFLNAGGGAYCDEISFHAYNSVTNGDMNLGRNSLDAFETMLTTYGLASKPRWQTESTGPGIIPYGIYHPRRARKALMETLLMEQYEIPRERNNWWYDVSHGFWDVPVWLENNDRSLEPAVVLGRVLAEETWGKPYASQLDFGTPGNSMFLGNVYTGTAGTTVAIMATSYMEGASVALTVTGDAGPITVVDGFGNETAMPLSKGRITIPMTDVPAYVRLPVGASVSVYRINGHSPRGVSASVSASASSKEIDGESYPVIADDGFQPSYGGGVGTAPTVPPGATWYAPTPSTSTLLWASDVTIDRVIVWCGPCWQNDGVLIAFDVETYNGSTWTSNKTVTKPSPDWFNFGSDESTAASFQETFWDEQWVFDVPLDAPVTCQGVRLNVSQASYGGEPLAASSISNGAGGGQGTDVQGYRLQEIAVVDSRRYAGVA